MFDDLPPDLDRLHTLRVWHARWVERIDRKIAAVRQRQAEEEHGRRTRPEPPAWIVELGIGTGRPPVQVHAGAVHGPDEGGRLLPAPLHHAVENPADLVGSGGGDLSWTRFLLGCALWLTVQTCGSAALGYLVGRRWGLG